MTMRNALLSLAASALFIAALPCALPAAGDPEGNDPDQVSAGEKAPLPSSPRSEDIFATADMLLIESLHPLNLYGSNGAHIKPVELRYNTFDAVSRAVEERNGETQRVRGSSMPEISRVRGELKTARASLAGIGGRMDMEIANRKAAFEEAMAEVADTAEKAIRLKKLEKDIAVVRSSFEGEKAAMEKKIAGLEAEFVKIAGTVAAFHYCGETEYRTLRKRIGEESRDAVRVAAARSKMKIVIDMPGAQAFSAPQKKEEKKDERGVVSEELESLIANGPSYTNVLNIITDITGGRQAKKNSPDGFGSIAGSVAKKRFGSMLAAKGSLDGIESPALKAFRSRKVLFGGRDLTGMAVMELYKKYNFPEDSLEAVRNYLVSSGFLQISEK